MHNRLDHISHLDTSQKKIFLNPANRIIRARMLTHDRYHEHAVQRDVIAEFEALVAWEAITCSYSGIEQAMKCLLKMRGAYIDKRLEDGGHRHHHVGRLFAELALEEQEVLRRSYAIYRSLHCYISPKTAGSFLDAIDSGYEAWRYFLLEGKRPPTTHPGAMLEIWSALTDILQAKVFTNHGLYTVKDRLDWHLQNRQSRAFREDGANSKYWPAMVQEIEDHRRVLINYYSDLIYRTTKHGDLQEYERPTWLALGDSANEDDTDNDYRYFLERAQTTGVIWNEGENQFEAPKS